MRPQNTREMKIAAIADCYCSHRSLGSLPDGSVGPLTHEQAEAEARRIAQGDHDSATIAAGIERGRKRIDG